jgi:hypothetical protein
VVSIDLVCIRCGFPQAAHTFGYCPEAGFIRSPGFVLMDSHALDDMPPARRALERARLAQQQHDRRVDVQLGLSSDGAFG